VPAGTVCCAGDPKHGSCPASGYHCCQKADGTFECCAGDGGAGEGASSTTTEAATSTSPATSNDPLSFTTDGPLTISTISSPDATITSSLAVTTDQFGANSTSSLAPVSTAGAPTFLVFEMKFLITIILFHLSRGALA